MSDILIRNAKAEDIPTLTRMWQALYDHQHEHGMQLPLAPDAAERWGRQVLERLDSPIARIFVAEVDGEVKGFLTAQVKRLPPMYAGGGKGGQFLEIWVDDDARNHHLGDRMVDAAVEWLIDAGATSIELQVVPENEGGIRFWKRKGWLVECWQLRRPLC